MGGAAGALSRGRIIGDGPVIFATVGTHEDPFDRLVSELDRLVSEGILKEPVVIQYGYSKAPLHCTGAKMMPFAAVQQNMAEARVVLTHGGPASIMQALSHGKIPIVVPRQPTFGEHVDGHQVAFARRLADRVLVLLEISELEGMLQDYERRIAKLSSPEPPAERARKFSARLDALCRGLL